MEYINSVSDEKMEGGVNMDAALDYIEEIGMDKVNRLGILLSEAGRADEFLKSLSDKKYQKNLFIEFGLEKSNN